jgi:hypothetical protein
VVCAKCQMGSRRLVTLLEIIQIHAQPYLTCLSGLQTDVNKLTQIEDEEDFWEDTVFVVAVHETLVYLDDICSKNELPVTGVLVSHVRRLMDVTLDKDDPLSQVAEMSLTVLLLSQYLERIRLTLIDELETKLLFQLPSNKKDWFENPTKNWENVIDRFPATVDEIEEMGKCFALSRYGAAVFHSLLVVEAGLIALGSVIGVTDPKAGWDATTKKLNDLVQGGHPKYPASLPINFATCEQINQKVQTMKHAWRNKVNHVAGRLVVMRSDFAPDIAEEIVIATRGFMRTLATDIPGSGPVTAP